MKKVKTLLIALICAMCLTFGVVFAACGDKDASVQTNVNGNKSAARDALDGEADGEDGSEENPFTFETGSLNLDIKAGGSVYYATYSFLPVTYSLESDSANVSLSVYNSMNPDGADKYESDASGFSCEVELGAREYYFLVFSSKDGAACEYSVYVEEVEQEAEEGSAGNPYIINVFREYVAETKEVEGLFGSEIQSVYYQYTASSDIILYFAAGDNTNLAVTYTVDDIPNNKVLNEFEDELSGGLEVKAGTVLLIEVSTANWTAGPVSFTISNVSLVADEGSEDNPYIITEFKKYDALTKEVTGLLGPEVVPVYYRYTASADITLYFAVGEDTIISVTYVGADDVPVTKVLNENEDELSAGLAVKSGTVLTIEVANAGFEAGPVSFTISNAAIGGGNSGGNSGDNNGDNSGDNSDAVPPADSGKKSGCGATSISDTMFIGGSAILGVAALFAVSVVLRKKKVN